MCTKTEDYLARVCKATAMIDVASKVIVNNNENSKDTFNNLNNLW